jgi:hypothetical protein
MSAIFYCDRVRLASGWDDIVHRMDHTTGAKVLNHAVLFPEPVLELVQLFQHTNVSFLGKGLEPEKEHHHGDCQQRAKA